MADSDVAAACVPENLPLILLTYTLTTSLYLFAVNVYRVLSRVFATLARVAILPLGGTVRWLNRFGRDTAERGRSFREVRLLSRRLPLRKSVHLSVPL